MLAADGVEYISAVGAVAIVYILAVEGTYDVAAVGAVACPCIRVRRQRWR